MLISGWFPPCSTLFWANFTCCSCAFLQTADGCERVGEWLYLLSGPDSGYELPPAKIHMKLMVFAHGQGRLAIGSGIQLLKKEAQSCAQCSRRADCRLNTGTITNKSKQMSWTSFFGCVYRVSRICCRFSENVLTANLAQSQDMDHLAETVR